MISRWPTRWEREQAARKMWWRVAHGHFSSEEEQLRRGEAARVRARRPWRRALRAVLWAIICVIGLAWFALATLGFWSMLSCAATARDTASAAYTTLQKEMARRAETPADADCLDAIEDAWRRAWDARRAEDFATWALGNGWRDLPACRDATFGGAP